VRLAVEPAGEVPAISTDEGLLRHVVRNLLSNAAKFTERGEIVVSVGLDGDDLVLAVRDTGVGIAEADQARVFEEFYQVRNPLQTKNKGTGLGLPLAHRLVAQLGGRLELASTPGQGSTFTLRLPQGPHPANVDLPAGAPWTA
jgi:signal transduction histidine kinase